MEKIKEAIRLLEEAQEEMSKTNTALVWEIKLEPAPWNTIARKWAEGVSRRHEKV